MRFGFRNMALGMALAAVPGWAQRPSEQETAAAVELSRKVALDYSKSLPDFVCTQEVHRFIDPQHRSQLRPLDTLTIKLSYFGQKEDHRLVLINGKATDQPYEALDGATTVGEFGGMLYDIFVPASQAVFLWEKWTNVHRRPAAVYFYRVASHSHYSLHIRGEDGTVAQTVVGFYGEVEVDRESGAVLHLTYIAGDIPKDFPIRSAATSVNYEFAAVGGKEYLLPAVAETDLKSTFLWTHNKSEFRDYRKFSAESSITFGTDKKQ